MTELEYLQATRRALSTQIAALDRRIAMLMPLRAVPQSPPYPMETTTAIRPETETVHTVSY